MYIIYACAFIIGAPLIHTMFMCGLFLMSNSYIPMVEGLFHDKPVLLSKKSSTLNVDKKSNIHFTQDVESM